MPANRLRALPALGQSIWLDQLQRDWLAGGQLAAWIGEDDLRGVTSNPSIFEAAIAHSSAYDGPLGELARHGLDAAAIYDQLTLEDIRAACDVFQPVYAATGGLDGYVSHEVSPNLAYDTPGTIAEAYRLWHAVDRPNVMIKIPATAEGMPAIRHCLAEGLNINITLMFSLTHYDAVAEAYVAALEARAARGLPLAHVASVASFFVSRIDTHVDHVLDARMKSEAQVGSAEAAALAALRGQAAIANAKRAYRRFNDVFTSPRFAALAAQGASPQRVLWASTSTKDPAYRDVLYIEELAGAHTVNTIPLATYEAFRDHGIVAPRLETGLDEADAVVAALGAMGIDLLAVGEILSRQGVDKFKTALKGVLATVEAKRQAVLG